MEREYEFRQKYTGKWFYVVIIVCLLFVCINSKDVQAKTKKITLNQDQVYGKYISNTDNYYYVLYPNTKFKNYKKFMKYTYKISDDSVIGLRINGDVDFNSWGIDDDGNYMAPYDIKVHALGPGKATLKVYDKKKLVDSYSFTVIPISTYSPSSYKINPEFYLEDYEDEDKYYKADKLIKKFTLEAADTKYTTTNQRILAALNANISYGGKVMSDSEYEKRFGDEDKAIDGYIYDSPYGRLALKYATAAGYAAVNSIVLNNLGFRCSAINDFNDVEIYEKNENYKKKNNDLAKKDNNSEDNDLKDNDLEDNDLEEDDLDEDEDDFQEDNEDSIIEEGELGYATFTATNKLKSSYDFTAKDDESIYKRTHLPAWIIGEDTAQQVVSVGQTKSLPSSDLNNVISSNTSVVKVENGKLVGVNPGVAIVCRYNDTYCDVFYVLVKKKGSVKTIKTKIHTKTRKSYFTTADYAPFIYEFKQYEDWENIRIFELEPALGHGGTLNTEYSKGKIKCYISYNGKSELLCTNGTERY